MSIDTAFIQQFRKAVAEHRKQSVNQILTGALDEKQYGYAAGYIKALDDIVADDRGADSPCIIDDVLNQMQRS